MTYRGVEICFASIMQASAKTVSRFFPVFRVYTSRIYGHRVMVMIMLVHDGPLSAWREYLENNTKRWKLQVPTL